MTKGAVTPKTSTPTAPVCVAPVGAAAGSCGVVEATTKVMVSPARSVKTTVPALCCANVQPGGYITDHATGAADEKVWKAWVDVY